MGRLDLDRLDIAQLRARRGEKWRQYPADVLPAWVAEMDYPIAQPIRAAVEGALALEDLGYPLEPPAALPEAFAERMAARFGWRIDPQRVEVLSEVVQGIYVALDRLTAPGDGVVVQTPVYPPFLRAVREMERRMVENPLVAGAARFEIDFDGLRAAAPGARAFLLCNPQNPTGRVFERRELEGIAELAAAHDWVVVADEIHADLVYPGAAHVPFASLGPEVEARTVTLSSASKAFNVPGLRCAVAHFGSEVLRKRFLSLPRAVRGGQGSLGQAATIAAWRAGDAWLAEVLAYLDGNRRAVARFVAERWPDARTRLPEATFLAWIDFRALGLAPSPYAFFLDRARVALSDGAAFGPPGRGFARLNFATSRPLLDEILGRMDRALRERTGR
jgi:cysteine-S-conjugate beta-lyase